MPNFLFKITNDISIAYNNKLPQRYVYSTSGLLGAATGVGSIVFGTMLLLSNLKGVSIPGINSIHSELDILGSSLLGGGSLGIGGFLLIGEVVVVKAVRKRQESNIDMSSLSEETDIKKEKATAINLSSIFN